MEALLVIDELIAIFVDGCDTNMTDHNIVHIMHNPYKEYNHPSQSKTCTNTIMSINNNGMHEFVNQLQQVPYLFLQQQVDDNKEISMSSAGINCLLSTL